jgi:hypothetical protein
MIRIKEIKKHCCAEYQDIEKNFQCCEHGIPYIIMGLRLYPLVA